MKIKKVLNNNAVIALNEKGEDVVVTGLGLAFKMKAGDLLKQEKVERVFHMESTDFSHRLVELIQEIPIEYVQITERILDEAKGMLHKTLNNNIYITLTDHICFAVERIGKNVSVKNPLLWEIKRFYRKEYEVGLVALDIIKEQIGVELPEDEAASIALHIVNAQMDEDMPHVVRMIRILQDTLSIIKYHFQIDFDENSLNYQRMVTHLKFFAQRVINSESVEDTDDTLYSIIKNQYESAYGCALKIKNYAKKEHDFEVSKEELAYLIVHIERVIRSNT